MESLTGIMNYLNTFGLLGGCVAIVFLLYSDRLVSGKRLRKMERERDLWRDMTLELKGIARQSRRIIERTREEETET